MKRKSLITLGSLRNLAAVLFLLLAFPMVTTANEVEDSMQETDALENLIPGATERWTGDFDGMLDRRMIRVLVVHNKMTFFLDKGQQRGATHDLFIAFEQFVNERLKSGTLKTRVVFIPVRRDRLMPALLEGKGDIAASNLTITEERQQIVDFSNPLVTGINEIVVTASSTQKLSSIDDLSGRQVYVRRSSSYYDSLVRLNLTFEKEGKQPVEVITVSELLEDSDLLEMVNAGLIPAIVVDSHKVDFWQDIFKQIRSYPDVAVNTDGKIGWAFRKGSPKLEEIINEFVRANKKGTLLGNILLKRYLKENKWARNATDPEELKKFTETVDLFKKYAVEYDFDFLMTTALAYQESMLDHSKRSHVGAIGIMQLMPTTAADKNVGIPDIENLESNIHAGTKYLRFLRDRYFDDREISRLNQGLFTFAAYNAGPARVAKLRKEASELGLDPNVWFNNVEIVAANRIGRETVQYVSNIFKYYTAYKIISERELTVSKAKSGG
jgi:membrane-bound lytic murein transglycosylase MltF